jgi:putative two-component system response regulator
VNIRRGALLHDIGKMGVPDAILHKNGPLDIEERRIIQQHPQNAFNMLKHIEYLQDALEIPYCHHEKWDGSGYPRGLKGDEIPISARMFALVDVYDALTNDRPYRKAMGIEETIAYLKSQSGTHFDPNIMDTFLSIVR